MHELGHVFGMEHEHQHADHDKHIEVLYKSLRDHEHCYQKVKVQESEFTEDDLCMDYRKAEHYGCMCREYVKGTDLDSQKIKADSKKLDYKSIMMHDSFDGAKDGCLDRFVDCPLACWTDPEDYSKGTGRVHIQRGIISDLDYE
ncbi:hypothetical protein N0V86_002467 [Didymella sp. IMI 355093]|nr:hypothetical protein N0V86_002467 [Didymella sp. IMI 355093]